MTQYVPCPRCGSAPEKVGFTWWGGVLGPKILTHVKCVGCGYKYNGKSGRDNTTGIVIYSVIVGVMSLGLVVVVFAALGLLTFISQNH
jgi:hypothetical protein